jgi:hypothetical protein
MIFSHQKSGVLVSEDCCVPFDFADGDTLTISHSDCFKVTIGSGGPSKVHSPKETPQFKFSGTGKCTLCCGTEPLTCGDTPHIEAGAGGGGTPPPPNTVVITTSSGMVTGGLIWGGGHGSKGSASY